MEPYDTIDIQGQKIARVGHALEILTDRVANIEQMVAMLTEAISHRVETDDFLKARIDQLDKEILPIRKFGLKHTP